MIPSTESLLPAMHSIPLLLAFVGPQSAAVQIFTIGRGKKKKKKRNPLLPF